MALQKPPTVSDDYRAIGIYRQAADIFFEKGFDATSMDDIADAVDMTKGGLYYYIKGKKAMLYAIMSFAMDLLDSDVIQPAQREEDPGERLAAILSGHARLIIRETSTMTLLVDQEEALDDEHRTAIRARKRAYMDFIRNTIEAALFDQERDFELDPGVAAHTVLGALHNIFRWHKDKPKEKADRDFLVDQLTRFTLHGLIPERSK